MHQSGGMQFIELPPCSPNLNPFAEWWVRSVKSECLSKLVPFGEVSLRRSFTEFLKHYHTNAITKPKTTCCSPLLLDCTMTSNLPLHVTSA
jgi:hypothetical protein